MAESRHDRIQTLVDQARHESVTADALDTALPRGSLPFGESTSRTILSYLYEGEQPHFVFRAKSNTPSIYGPSDRDPPERSLRNRVYHVVTDERWLMIAGHRDGNQTLELTLDDIEAANYDTEGLISRISNNRIVLRTADAYYDIPVANAYDEQDFNRLLSYLWHTADIESGGVSLDPDEAGYTIDGVDRHETDGQTVATLLDEVPPGAESEADRIIANTDDADELVRRLNELIEEHADRTESETLDDKVAAAESVDALRQEVRRPAEKRLDELAARKDARVDDLREVAQTVDPEVVGQYAVGAGRTAHYLSDDLPYKNLLALGAMVAGAGGGVYAETHPDSALADLDPVELANRATAAARRGENLDTVDGEALGALLGASAYLGESLAPAAYAQWITQADVDAIMLGVERGAEYAVGNRHRSRRGAMLVGGGLGLFAGYANVDDSDDALRETLDEETYKEYLHALAEEGVDLAD